MKGLLVIYLFFLSANTLFSAHIIGGDFSYKCTGAGTYDFTLTMYRDCNGNGGQFDSFGPNALEATVTVYRGTDQDPVTTFVLDAPTVELLSPEEINPCTEVPPNICVQEGVYKFPRDLPVSSEPYYVVYQRCCRNDAITNIINSGDTGMTFVLEITPEAQTFCNSSPEFVDFPPPVFCVNESLNFDHSATDPDGDFLVYEFCSPLSGGTDTDVAPAVEPPPPYNEVNFQLPNFSALNPVGGDPQITIDPVTGFITGKPDIQGKYVVGVCVTEFRDGVELSHIQRDFQFNITECDPNLEVLIQDYPEATLGAMEVKLCGSKEVELINQSQDIDFINGYFWDFEFPGATNLTFDTKDVAFTLPDYGVYTGLMVLNPGDLCSDSLKITIKSSPEIETVISSAYDTCTAGPVQFVDLSPARPDFPLVDWNWGLGDGISSTEQFPLVHYDSAGVKLISLIVRDTLGCIGSSVMPIAWQPAPEIVIVEPSRFNVCPETEIQFANASFPVDDSYILNWDFGEGNTGSGIYTQNTFSDPGRFDIAVQIISPIGCVASDTFVQLIFVDSLPIADFETIFPPDFNILNNEAQFTETSIRAIGWDWYFSDGGEDVGPETLHEFRDTGTHSVTLVAEHILGCYDTLSILFDVAPVSSFQIPNALSPNQDGINEFWKPKGLFLEQLESYEVVIYNRWGSKIWESSNPLDGWPGTDLKGKLVPMGGYPYQLRYKAPRKGPEVLEGMIMVIY